MSTKPFGQLIDAWAQPALTNLLQHVPEGERLLRASRSPLLERTMDPDQTVAEMDHAGIRTLMLSAWCRPGKWVYTNDEIAVFVKRHPDRFVGVAAVDLLRPVQAVQELDRATRPRPLRLAGPRPRPSRRGP
jgi:predicted TIM-barrel fold metal-dependent hydrolase